MEAIETLRTRRSIRKYKPEGIPKADLETILDCGRMAPTGSNIQPWTFVVVDDKAVLKELADASLHGKFIAGAACAVLVFVKKGTMDNVEDGSSATVNMLNAARALGYGGCWINSYRNDNHANFAKVLNAPEELELITTFTLGVPDETPNRPKKTLEEIVHYNRF